MFKQQQFAMLSGDSSRTSSKMSEKARDGVRQNRLKYFFFSQDYAMFCGLACDSIAMETGSKIFVATVRLHTLHSHTKHPPINPPAEI